MSTPGTSGGASPWAPKIVKESGIGLAGSLVGAALNYALLLTITRFLTPNDLGVFSLGQSVIAVALIFVLLGTPRALDRFIPHYVALGEPGRAGALIRGVLRITSGAAAVMVIVLWLSAGWLSRSVFHLPALSQVLRLMLLTVPLLAWIELVCFSFVGFKELRYGVYVQQLAIPLLKIGLAAVVFSLGFGLKGWVLAYVMALFLAGIFALGLFRRHIGRRLLGEKALAIDLKSVVSYSWPLSINNLLLMVSANLSILLLGYFRSAAEVGVYRVYVYMVVVLVLARTSFARIYKPVASEISQSAPPRENEDLYRRVGKWMLMAALFFGVGVALVGRDLIAVLFPESYNVAVPAFITLAAGHMAVAAMGPQDMALEAFGNTRLSMLNGAILLSANLALGLLLVPRLGIMGAALSAALATVMAAAAGLAQVWTLHGLHPFGRRYVMCVVAAALAGVCVAVVRSLAGPPGLAGIGVAVLILGGLFVVGLRTLGALDAQDHEVLRRVRARIVRATGGER